MSCLNPLPTALSPQRVRDLETRVRRLENELAGIKEVYGVCTSAAELTVPVISMTYSETTDKFTIKFTSTAGENYQVQTSTNGVAWTTANGGNFVAAASGTAVMTTWVSTDTYDFEDLPVYFRVRRYPVATAAYAPA